MATNISANDTGKNQRYEAQHHPSEELLCLYSAGSVSSAQALCIAAHLDYCDRCRSINRRNNRLGAELFETSEEQNVSLSFKNSIFSKLDEASEVAIDVTTSAETVPNEVILEPINHKDIKITKSIRKLVPRGFDELHWQMISISAHSAPLMKDENRTKIGLLKLKPGGKVAKHHHLGDEYTVVLAGNFSDEDGVYGPGDFLLREPSEQHTPIATRDGECICLTAQEGPLQFTGRLFGVLNPLLRFEFEH